MLNLIVNVDDPNQGGLLESFASQRIAEQTNFVVSGTSLPVFHRPVIASASATEPWVDDWTAADVFEFAIGNPGEDNLCYAVVTPVSAPNGFSTSITINTIAVVAAFEATTEDAISTFFSIKRARATGAQAEYYQRRVVLKRSVVDPDSAIPTSAPQYIIEGPIISSGLTASTGMLLGRYSASTGAVEEITVGSGIALSGSGVLTSSGGGGSGDVTSAGDNTFTGLNTFGGNLFIDNYGTIYADGGVGATGYIDPSSGSLLLWGGVDGVIDLSTQAFTGTWSVDQWQATALDVNGTVTATGLSLTSANTTEIGSASAVSIVGDSLTEGTLMRMASSSLTEGKLLDLVVTGTATGGFGGQTGLAVSLTGVSDFDAATTYGAIIRNQRANTTGTNFALALEASGNSTNTALQISAGRLRSLDTTASTSTATGSGIFGGGVGIAEKLFVGSTISAAGTIELGHSDDTTISRVSGGVVSIEGNNIVTDNILAGGTKPASFTTLAASGAGTFGAATAASLALGGATLASGAQIATNRPIIIQTTPSTTHGSLRWGAQGLILETTYTAFSQKNLSLQATGSITLYTDIGNLKWTIDSTGLVANGAQPITTTGLISGGALAVQNAVSIGTNLTVYGGNITGATDGQLVLNAATNSFVPAVIGGAVRSSFSTTGFNIGTGRILGWTAATANTATLTSSLSEYASGVIQFGTTTNNDVGSWRATNGTLLGTLAVTGISTFTAGSKLGATVIGSLPAAGSNTYLELIVTDSLVPVVGSTVVAGGSAKAKVCSNGTNWIVTAPL